MEKAIRMKRKKTVKKRELKSISPTRKNTALVEECYVHGSTDSIFSYLGTTLRIDVKDTTRLANIRVRDIHKQKELDKALQEAPHNKIEVEFINLSLYENKEGAIYGFADTYNILRLI